MACSPSRSGALGCPVSDAATVTFKGEQFRVSDSIALMALIKFAHVAKGGTDSNEMDGLAAMYDLLSSAIAEDEWSRFQDHAIKTRATDADLMTLVRKVINRETERPTSRPSDSSDGPEITEPSSEDDSSTPDTLSLRVVRRLEAEGRPDKALMVLMAGEMAGSAA